MSLRPAIGRRWIEKYWSSVYPSDEIHISGNTYRPPRYYDKWMDEHHPEVMLEVREKRYEQEQLDAYKRHAMERAHISRDDLFGQRNQV